MKIKHLMLTVVISAALVITGFAPVSYIPAANAPAGGDSGIASVYASSSRYVKCGKMYRSINKFRTKKKVWEWKKGSKKKKYYNTKNSNKLGKLKRSKSLEKTAKRRAKELAKRYDHTRPNGSSCFTIYPSKYSWLGENIAYGYETVDEVMKAWIEENEKYGGQGHRRNLLLKNFKYVGVACYEYHGWKYWVQCFGG